MASWAEIFLFDIIGIMSQNNKLRQLESLSKMILALYLLILLWLLLFKFSFDIIFVIEEHQARSLNVIPFTGQLREMIDNLTIFIPFGLLLSVNFKQITFWQKLAIISFFSLTIEIIQFILAIGITDITDVIMNVLGGLVGLVLYAFGGKRVDSVKLNYFINILGLILIITFLALRFFVFRVKY